ncbi:MAG: prepilin-type N-terminal cleavage/methylation domain-containing protein [Acidobacteria bacterium]|nr:prepilin-type N-terminal cleavage/methylation domain-containing protein [Acidobacteriota bacterium]
MEKRQEGFTLLELVVSLTLLSLVVGIVFAGFRSGLDAWKRSDVVTVEAQRLRAVTDLVKKQVGSIFPLTVVEGPGGYTPESLVSEEERALAAFASQETGLPYLRGTSSTMDFATVAPLKWNKNAGLLLASYRQEDDAWVAVEKPYYGSSFLKEGRLEALQGDRIVLLRDLASLKFAYYRRPTETEPAGWVEEWDASVSRSFPCAIAMEFQFRTKEGGPGKTGHLVVAVHAQPVPQGRMAQRNIFGGIF